jgi:hypothetical protein
MHTNVRPLSYENRVIALISIIFYNWKYIDSVISSDWEIKIDTLDASGTWSKLLLFAKTLCRMLL